MPEMLQKIYAALDGLKLTDIVQYDFRSFSPLFDYLVIATASNERQVHASIRHLTDELAGLCDVKKIEGAGENRWILFDLGSVIVNVMHRDEREYYRLENLFVERPRIANPK